MSELKGERKVTMHHVESAEELMELRDYHRDSQRVCPKCGEDCGRVALVKLAYVFATCNCEQADYSHLVEQVYHRTCLSADD